MQCPSNYRQCTPTPVERGVSASGWHLQQDPCEAAARGDPGPAVTSTPSEPTVKGRQCCRDRDARKTRHPSQTPLRHPRLYIHRHHRLSRYVLPQLALSQQVLALCCTSARSCSGAIGRLCRCCAPRAVLYVCSVDLCRHDGTCASVSEWQR